MILLRETKEGIFVDVLVKPGSKVAKIGFDPSIEKFIISVKSPPTKGKANKESLRTLKNFLEKLGYSSAQCKIVRGHTNRSKVVLVKNININEFREQLKDLSFA